MNVKFMQYKKKAPEKKVIESTALANTPADIIKKYFNDNLGFGESKPVALSLLSQTINILEEFDIKYFAISGTLLGIVRHNDLIPWDDDIDLIVDESVLSKIGLIAEKYAGKINFGVGGGVVKTCFPDKINRLDCVWSKWMIDGSKYMWPFVDLFVYKISKKFSNQMIFFGKSWHMDKFFPANQLMLGEILISVPCEPDYFLKRNYGSKYMTVLRSNNWSHKNEKRISDIVSIGMDDYQANK